MKLMFQIFEFLLTLFVNILYSLYHEEFEEKSQMESSFNLIRQTCVLAGVWD
jgi:hypothetical protein